MICDTNISGTLAVAFAAENVLSPEPPSSKLVTVLLLYMSCVSSQLKSAICISSPTPVSVDEPDVKDCAL